MAVIHEIIDDWFCILLNDTGHYIPQLAKFMVQFNKKEKIFNLKGIAVRIKSILLLVY